MWDSRCLLSTKLEPRLFGRNINALKVTQPTCPILSTETLPFSCCLWPTRAAKRRPTAATSAVRSTSSSSLCLLDFCVFIVHLFGLGLVVFFHFFLLLLLLFV